MKVCFWCARDGKRVPATKDGGRFGPLCDKCADKIQVIFMNGVLAKRIGPA